MLLLDRAENEIALAEIVFTISADSNLQLNITAREPKTFYSAVISHAYYAIFYSAKAYLEKKQIIIRPPEEHRKVLEAFTVCVESGELDVELLRVYKELLMRADELLGILREEKSKRGKYTYKTLPQANHDPAKESLDNAKKFFRTMYSLSSDLNTEIGSASIVRKLSPFRSFIGSVSKERAEEMRRALADARAPSIRLASIEELQEEIERRRQLERASKA